MKYTYTASKQRTTTYNVGSGLAAARPMFAAGFTYANANSTTTQAADDTVCPNINKLRLILYELHSAFATLGS
jgi:hypothetical protein